MKDKVYYIKVKWYNTDIDEEITDELFVEACNYSNACSKACGKFKNINAMYLYEYGPDVNGIFVCDIDALLREAREDL